MTKGASETTTYTKFQSPAESNKDDFCCGLCCFKGCLFGTIGFLYFFLIIPAGILLVFHGMNNEMRLTIIIGVVVLVVPTCVTIPAAFAIHHYYRKCKDRKAQRRDARKTYQYESPFKADADTQVQT